MAFEERLLWKTCDIEMEEVENCLMKSFMIRVLRVVLGIRIINSKRPRWTGMWHAREKTVMRV
jgi:hypothetical protein